MKTIIKLFLMTHNIPVLVKNNDALMFYSVVAKRHGMRIERSLWLPSGFVMN